jgi:hypothetical protein
MEAPLFCPLAVQWGDVATWFSGVASATAVGVALHLARRAERPKAEAWLSIMVTTDALDRPFVTFVLSNLDTQPLRVTGCSVQLIGPAKWGMKWSSAVANDWRHPTSWRIPADVPRGETFRYATDTDTEPFKGLLADSWLPAWLTVKFVRASVHTPWGAVRCKIAPDVLKKWRAEIVEYRRNQPTPPSA